MITCMSQVVVALSTLAAKGCLVLRIWALWEHQNVGLLFLVNCVFAEVKVCRPSTVQLAGEDIFLVCTGFKGLGQAHRAALCRYVLVLVVWGQGARAKVACLVASHNQDNQVHHYSEASCVCLSVSVSVSVWQRTIAEQRQHEQHDLQEQPSYRMALAAQVVCTGACLLATQCMCVLCVCVCVRARPRLHYRLLTLCPAPTDPVGRVTCIYIYIYIYTYIYIYIYIYICARACVCVSAHMAQRELATGCACQAHPTRMPCSVGRPRTRARLCA